MLDSHKKQVLLTETFIAFIDVLTFVHRRSSITMDSVISTVSKRIECFPCKLLPLFSFHIIEPISRKCRKVWKKVVLSFSFSYILCTSLYKCSEFTFSQQQSCLMIKSNIIWTNLVLPIVKLVEFRFVSSNKLLHFGSLKCVVC